MLKYKQFIIHKSKVPSDYRTGAAGIDPHNSAYWTDQATATAASSLFGPEYGVGFVFTKDCGMWFLDIDKCLLSGYWSSKAVELCNLFRGCYMEVSQSGTGLHIVGSGTVPPHACRNREHGLELYTEGRYMALGVNQHGDPSFDASAIMSGFVSQYFPPELEVAARLSDGHELGWELPGDEELIARALAMTGSHAARFQGRVTFRELWEADAAALSRSWPAEGREDGLAYDPSSADLALASKLCWLTGNDGARVDGLMRKSGLYRDKWDKHKTYLSGFTLPRAAVRDGSFWDPKYKERRDQQKAELREMAEEGSELPAAGKISLAEMLANYAYVIEGKRIVDIRSPRRIFSKDEWCEAYKSSREAYQTKDFNVDGTPKLKMMETTKLWAEDERKLRVDSITFRPGSPIMTTDPEGKCCINTWRPIERAAGTGVAEAGLFLRHISYLFADDADRFLDWLAHIEQQPGVLPHTGWVHVSPMQGTGRNWLSSLLFHLWRPYVAPSFDLSGALRSGFNGGLGSKLLAIVDEINEGGSHARWENAETLKSIVTPAYRNINPKFGHQRVEHNACRWLIFSNHISALPLTEGDRRFNVVHNAAAPLAASYYKELYAALNRPDFISAVGSWLAERDLSRFNPGEHAAFNEAKRELVAASRSEADDVLLELIQSHPADVIANSTLAGLLSGQPGFGATLKPAHVHAMRRAGLKGYGKAVLLQSGAIIKVSILRNHELWKTASADKIRQELDKHNAHNAHNAVLERQL